MCRNFKFGSVSNKQVVIMKFSFSSNESLLKEEETRRSKHEVTIVPVMCGNQ